MSTAFTQDSQSDDRRSLWHLAVTWALLLPMVFFAVHGVFSFQESGGASNLSGLVPTRQGGMLGYVIIPGIAYLVVGLVILINFHRILAVAMQMKVFTLLALLTIASALWSQDPLRSLYNGVFYSVGTAFAYYLVIRFRPREIMSLVLLTGLAVCATGLVFVFFFPQFGIDNNSVRTAGAWKGIFIGRTAAAKCLVYLVSPALVFGYSRLTYRKIGYVLLAVLSIVKAKAVTAIVILAAYALLMASLYIARRFDRRTAVLFGLVVLTAVAVVVALSIPVLPHILQFVGRDPTLTGRTEVWRALMPSVEKQPILGYGFYAFWQGLNGESANAIVSLHWYFGYAHNGLLEIALQLGAVGLAFFIFTLVKAFKDAWICIRYSPSVGIEWYLGIVVLVVLYNFDEATVLLPNDLLSILYIVACCGLSIKAKEVRHSSYRERLLEIAYNYRVGDDALVSG